MAPKKRSQSKLRHEKSCKRLGIKVNSKRYRRYTKAGLLENLDEEYVKEVQEYWRENYNKSVDPILHLAIYNLTGKKDVRFVPGPEMWHDFIPFFNDRCMVGGYKDKSIYDILIKTESTPKIILKRVRGHYFNTQNNQVDQELAEKLVKNSGYKKFIIKPSNTNNGVGIELIQIKEDKIFFNDDEVSLENLGALYGYNFIIQEVIEQHEVMKTPHPSSVNTLRMVTQRWDNEIHYLLTFARFGADNSVKDNAGTGGVCVGVNIDGEFSSFAVDEDCNAYKSHPTTDYRFANMHPIPFFNKYIDFVKDLHKDILHMDFISWDIAVGKDGEPIFLEANFAGATWLYQFATAQPIFGNMTEEILDYVKSNMKTNRDIGIGVEKLRQKNKRMKRKNNKNKKVINKLEGKLEYESNKNVEMGEDIERLRSDNMNLLNSVSWKITSPLRKIKKHF